MINIYINNKFFEEKKYVIDVIFSEFLQLEYILHASPEYPNEYRVEYNCVNINIPDLFFSLSGNDLVSGFQNPNKPMLIPIEKFHGFTSFFSDLPVIYYRHANVERVENDTEVNLDFDIIGTIFFMLSRIEEYAISLKDEYGRKAFKEFNQVKNGLAHRPIVDEYVSLLLYYIKQKFFDHTPNRNYIFDLSHDVDAPLSVVYSFKKIIKKCAADVFIRKELSFPFKRIIAKANEKYWKYDPNNNFDYLVQVNNKHNISSQFNFICVPGTKGLDGEYNIQSKFFKQLIKKLADTGNKIGFHPSYFTFCDLEKTKNEYNILRNVCAELNIKQDNWGGRQHYLRWQAPVSWDIWEQLGLDFDSSVGFDVYNGFRAGTSLPYSTYNINTKKKNKLKEKPLICMDHYQYLLITQRPNVIDEMAYYSSICKYYKGNFSLLMHNNYILTPKEKSTYEAIIAVCK